MAERTLFELGLTGGAATNAYRDRTGDVDGDYPWASLDPASFSERVVELARVGWTHNALNEYCSASAMAQLTQALVTAGAPIDLCAMAARFPGEELFHAELCARVAMQLGGGAPLTFDPDDLAIPCDADLTPLQRANELIVRICCVGETFSLPILVGAMRVATHPLTHAVLTTLVRDEAEHGRLGWLYLEWIAGELDPAERDRLGRAATETREHMQEIWLNLRAAPELPPDVLEQYARLGWMSRTDYADRAMTAMDTDVMGRLAGFGIG